jgi:hypothetical protein
MHWRISTIYVAGAAPAEEGRLERHALLLRHQQTDLADGDVTCSRTCGDETAGFDFPSASDCVP